MGVKLVEQLIGRFGLRGELIEKHGLGMIDQRSVGGGHVLFDRLAAITGFPGRDLRRNAAVDEFGPVFGF